MLSGATATFSVTVTNGLNARVRWDFDDGTPVTPYSIQQVVPGVHVDGPAPELEDELRALHERFTRGDA